MVKTALRDRRESGGEKRSREERYGGGRKISSLLKGAGVAGNEQQLLFLCHPPEKSAGNMLQRKKHFAYRLLKNRLN